jgi:hypothetical protein
MPVLTTPAKLRYLDADLDMTAVSGVTTSLVARKQRFASKLTALAVARQAAEGAPLAGLGMFEQGYYNRVGFGTGGHELFLSFDPAEMNALPDPRPPIRLSKDDWEQAHAARMKRLPRHGLVSAANPELTKAEMIWNDQAFGFGYRNEDGELTHYLWGGAESRETGPVSYETVSFQTWEQFLELMSLIRSFGDQYRLVRMIEPPGVMLQDLLKRPFRCLSYREEGKFRMGFRATASQQYRMNDVPRCVAAMKLRGEPVRFNLKLSDPIDDLLDADAPWQGAAGDYFVELGPESSAAPGAEPSLPLLEASVNAFTRLWLGVRPASGLAVTDALHGPAELISALDEAIRLPYPQNDWPF